MTKSKWKQLLKTLKTDSLMGELSPVDKAALDSFESTVGVKLPSSYRLFCSVFGAGEFARAVGIAAPGFQGKSTKYSLERLQSLAKEDLEYEEYSPDPGQHARSVFFANDIVGSMYFFDPYDITDVSKNEYGVYRLFRDWEVQRIADDFWIFVTNMILGEQHKKLFEDEEPPELIFRPVSK